MRSRPANFNHAVAGGGGGGGGGGEVGQGGRTKRTLDVPPDYDPINSKKARIAVELLPPQQTQAGTKNQNKGANAASKSSRAPAPGRTAPKTQAVAGDVTAVAPRKGGATTTNNEKITNKLAHDGETDPNITKHQAKVINGIKHELDRLRPEASVGKEQGRKLRSQEATRFKSELSAYFPDYDEVIGNEPKEERELPPP